MTSVWYTGTAQKRTISSGDWNAVGVSDVGSFSWDQTNGYSISTAEFTLSQLAWLEAESDFWTSAPDGPRTGSTPVPGAAEYITQADLELYLLSQGKAGVGLGKVDNTADVDKPLSLADIAALKLKADYPSGGTNGQMLVKSGTTTAWAAPSGGGSVGVTQVADTFWASGTAFNITGTGVAAVADSFWASGQTYTVN